MTTSQESGSQQGGALGLGASPMMQELALRTLFGLEDQQEAIWQQGHLIGRTINRSGFESFGVLEARLLAPTMTSPKSTLRLSTNGVINVIPTELNELGNALKRWSKAVEDEFVQAQLLSANYDLVNMVMRK